MHYYIDGYNLMFRAFKAEDRKLEQNRNKMIASLKMAIDLLKLDVTIVFDAQYLGSEESRISHGALEVIFTQLGQTADQYICEQLSNATFPKRHTVVTSDRELARSARSYAAKSESVEAFIQWLNQRCLKKFSHYQHRHRPEAPPPKQTVSPPKLPSRHPSSAPEGSLDYYLKEFEQRLKKDDDEDFPDLSPKTKKKKMRAKNHGKKGGDFEMVRWLEIFEAQERLNLE